MVYAPPTKAGLRLMVARDLRDPNLRVYSAPEVDDLVNFGIVEVSRVYPITSVETVDIVPDTNLTDARRQYRIRSREVSRIEVHSGGRFREQVPERVDEGDSGWDLFGDILILPTWLRLDDKVDNVHVYGYQGRAALTDDSDVLEGDAEAEMGVRLFAAMTGYQRLQNDRALFQQWLAIPGNTDVSPTQLDGMANTYLAQWSRHRNHIRTLRR